MSAPTKKTERGPGPLLHPAAAFVAAGVCSSAAGYLVTTGAALRDAFAAMGIELPWITSFVLENPTGLPAALVLASVALVGLSMWHVGRSEVLGGVRALVLFGALLTGSAACAFVGANVLALNTLHTSIGR